MLVIGIIWFVLLMIGVPHLPQFFYWLNDATQMEFFYQAAKWVNHNEHPVIWMIFLPTVILLAIGFRRTEVIEY